MQSMMWEPALPPEARWAASDGLGVTRSRGKGTPAAGISCQGAETRCHSRLFSKLSLAQAF